VANREKRLAVRYWPVGQGLFSSAELLYRQAGFHLVYDCGTSTSPAPGWFPLGGWARNRPIDLLVISHFHADHISGVPALVTGRAGEPGVRRAWVPYASPKEQVLRAASLAAEMTLMDAMPADAADLAGLVSNPSEWLGERGVPVDVIGGPDESEGGPPPPMPTPEGPLEPPVPVDDDSSEEPLEGIYAGPVTPWPRGAGESSPLRVAWAPVGPTPAASDALLTLITWVKPLPADGLKAALDRLSGCPSSPARDLLVSLVGSHASGLDPAEVLDLATQLSKTGEPKAIRELYRALQTELNSTSLFLLGQAARVSDWRRTCYGHAGGRGFPWAPVAWPWGPFWPCPDCPRDYPMEVWWRELLFRGHASKLCPTFLWSGDAPTEVLAELLNDAQAPLRQRIEATTAWQVPHHGARSSLCPELYAALGPSLPVISCGIRNRYRHPNLEVTQRSGAAVMTEIASDILVFAKWR
jgi:beta-lactamase superfamily II metal-dependent hydrolase